MNAMQYPTQHILIIDDRQNFAVQVWRYLSGDPGFGDDDIFSQDGLVWRRALDDGRYVVWWIDTEPNDQSDSEALLADALAKIAGEPIALALVDQTGRRRRPKAGAAPSDGVDADRYDWRRMWLTLYAQLGPSGSERIKLVSAYKGGLEEISIPGERRTVLVHAKSHDLLVDLLHELRDEPSLHRVSVGEGDHEVAHVLITGAGFEIGSPAVGLGVPSTSEMLRVMFESFLPEISLMGKGQCPPAARFPVVDNEDPRLGAVEHKLHVNAAMAANLDDYFTNLFLFLKAQHDQSDESRRLSREREMEIRDAFRRVLLSHDWGQMRQSVAAAELPWVSWVSTNYTGFSDRAIRAVVDHHRWRVVSSAQEAQTVIGTQMDIRSRAHEPNQATPPDFERRTLFKVHGDIHDVRTMALAGQDKGIDTQLWVSIESLHKLYMAAQEFLKTRLRCYRRIYYHVVGHDLQDRHLVAMLREIIRDLRPVQGPNPCPTIEQTFILVNVAVKGPLERALAGQLANNVTVVLAPMTAAEYMARIRRSGLGPGFDLAAIERSCEAPWRWRQFPGNSDAQVREAKTTLREWGVAKRE